MVHDDAPLRVWHLLLIVALAVLLFPLVLLCGCSAGPTLEPGFRWYTATDRQGVVDEVVGGGDVRMRR